VCVDKARAFGITIGPLEVVHDTSDQASLEPCSFIRDSYSVASRCHT
jgi:hypothetical protein